MANVERDGFVKLTALAAMSHSWHSSYVRAEKVVYCCTRIVVT